MEFIYKNFNVEQAQERLESRILNAQECTKITNAMTRAAIEMDGKQLTKRYSNKVQDILGDEYRVLYHKESGMIELYFRHKNLSDGTCEILIGYEGEERDLTINASNIEERAKAYYLDSERLPKLIEAREHIASYIERLNEAQKLVKNTLADADKYDVSYLLSE